MKDFFCVCFLNDRTREKQLFEISFRRNDFNLLKYFLKEIKGLKGYNNIHYDSQLIEFIQSSRTILQASELYQYSQKVIDAPFPFHPEWKLKYQILIFLRFFI